MADVTRLRVRGWYAADAALRRIRPSWLSIGLRAVHSGALLGTSTPELLVAIDEEAYARRYAYHDTDAHNLRGWFDWERDVLQRAFPARGRVLLTAAGGGREVIALRRMGHEVVACECNEVLRARANDLLARLGLGGDVRLVARDRCLTDAGPFDAAIVGWGSYTFIRGTEQRRGFLRELATSLRPGAPILLSFFARTRDSRRLRTLQAVARAVGSVAGGTPVELGDLMDPTWQHSFSRAEIEDEVRSAGLTLDHFSTEGYAHAVARRT